MYGDQSEEFVCAYWGKGLRQCTTPGRDSLVNLVPSKMRGREGGGGGTDHKKVIKKETCRLCSIPSPPSMFSPVFFWNMTFSLWR